MEYKNYTFEIDMDDLVPPIPGTIDEFRFVAKPIYMRSPEGKLLWRDFGDIGIGETYGYTKKDAEEKVIEKTKKWIDGQLKNKKNS